MLVVLSPAKAMLVDDAAAAAVRRTPRFAAVADSLAASLRALQPAALGKWLEISPALAALNAERYKTWATQPVVAAGVAMDGPAYKALALRGDAGVAGAADERVRILSGLYGLLRPLDGIRPYRLEMGTAKLGAHLDGVAESSLYEFWGRRIADSLLQDARERAAATGQPAVIVNAASAEYWKSVGPHLAGSDVRVVTATFPGPAVHAKAARGAIARHAAANRLDAPDGLKAFTGVAGEWAYDAGASSDANFVFRRGPPAPAPRRGGGASKAAAPKQAKQEGDGDEEVVPKAGKRGSAPRAAAKPAAKQRARRA